MDMERGASGKDWRFTPAWADICSAVVIAEAKIRIMCIMPRNLLRPSPVGVKSQMPKIDY